MLMYIIRKKRKTEFVSVIVTFLNSHRMCFLPAVLEVLQEQFILVKEQIPANQIWKSLFDLDKEGLHIHQEVMYSLW